jgi:hypothetical protein
MVAPVQDLFSVPAGSPRGRTELPFTAPSPILAMQPQVAAEVAKSFASNPAADSSSAASESTGKSNVRETTAQAPTEKS